jgi:hypothetical protein
MRQAKKQARGDGDGEVDLRPQAGSHHLGQAKRTMTMKMTLTKLRTHHERHESEEVLVLSVQAPKQERARAVD